MKINVAVIMCYNDCVARMNYKVCSYRIISTDKQLDSNEAFTKKPRLNMSLNGNLYGAHTSEKLIMN